MQLEQYQEVLRLYCSTKVEKLKEIEKFRPILSETLIYETCPLLCDSGDSYRGEITFGYSKTDVKANKLIFEFSHRGMKTKYIRCQVDFTVLPHTLVKRDLLGHITTESLVINDIWVSHFEPGFPISLINKTLLEGLLGVVYEE